MLNAEKITQKASRRRCSHQPGWPHQGTSCRRVKPLTQTRIPLTTSLLRLLGGEGLTRWLEHFNNGIWSVLYGSIWIPYTPPPTLFLMQVTSLPMLVCLFAAWNKTSSELPRLKFIFLCQQMSAKFHREKLFIQNTFSIALKSSSHLQIMWWLRGGTWLTTSTQRAQTSTNTLQPAHNFH